MARPKKALLTPDLIVDAAMALGDRHGNFTVTQLASALRVHPSSLYHHVTGREEVVDLMRARIASTIDDSPVGVARWDEAFERLAWSYRAAFAAHAGSIRLLATSRVRDSGTLAVYDRISAMLLDAGFPSSKIMPMIVAFDNFVIGSAFWVADEPVDAYFEVDADMHRSLTRIVEDFEDEKTAAQVAFGLGLDALLQGFRVLLTREGTTPITPEIEVAP
ncbi:MAG: TetR/AcrR family transcriptional regulator C-terminal domain-containing protein [Rhodococcus sp. (in: high G+C Gram-positive bacteria)]